MSHTYYGTQTLSAIENFPFPIHGASFDLVYAITQIKQAAAIAHKKVGELPAPIADAIVQVCGEILNHSLDDQFVTPALQGGAGTSLNMNVNEVIAGRANVLLSALTDLHVHPNDHVNRSQSTNDVNPSALRIVCIHLTYLLLGAIDHLTHVMEERAGELQQVKKLGRTHLQDALPTTLGAELLSYAAVIARDRRRIEATIDFLYDLNLGGTAIGNSINASPAFIDAFYESLADITQLKVRRGSNLMSLTSSQSDFFHLSATLVALSVDLSKIATDFRFMASGPRGGIGEIMLQALQPGSSIMPGKINPVIPESINQIYYYVSGNHLTIEHAAEGAHLELGIMFPILAESLISSLKMIQAGILAFADNCIATFAANQERCRELLEKSTVYATLLAPSIGYDQASLAVKEAIHTGRSIRDIILDKQIMTEAEFDELTSVV